MTTTCAGIRSPLRQTIRSGNRSPPSSSSRPPSPSPPPVRRRLDSRDIPRTYSGMFGQGGANGDLMPFELARNRNTEWVKTGGPMLLIAYLSVILVFHAAFMAFVPFHTSWTVTHAAHFVVTSLYLHWIKGSPDFYEQGEMNALTTWEQIDSTTGLSMERRAMFLVPTLICYAACHFAHYDVHFVAANVLILAFEIIAKLPTMNGVRILGINRTAGIDDERKKK